MLHTYLCDHCPTDRLHFQEILVLHLVDGKDYFISVTGHLVPTAFGCTIKELVRMVEPVRQHNLLVDVEGKVRLVEQHRAVQRMSDYWKGTGF